MNWKDVYQEKLTTADEAVKRIKSGDRVVMGIGAGVSATLNEALINNHAAYQNVEIVNILPIIKTDYLKHELASHFHTNSLFVHNPSRKLVNEGIGDYTPCFLYQTPELWTGELPVDVAFIQISKPDKHGYCSYGIGVDYTKSAADQAKLVIAHVNDQMPRTHGDSFIHVSELDVIVEHSEPLLAPPTQPIGELETAIGKHCASLIQDGDCLQLGYGKIPDAVLSFLTDRKDLGIHTEMFSDGVVDLVNAGVINNSKKNFNPGKIISAFLLGTQKLYDFVDDNPSVLMYPVTYTNDPYIAGQNDNLVSINGCIQVDLLGQVASDTMGMQQFSGVGGQVDFVRAAAISKGGRSILAMPATAKGDTISRIVPFLDHGAAVTTSRQDVHYIVTEFGVANLKHKTLKERARALINIAHPKFHDELKAAFEQRFNVAF
ncbi:MAG: 4-hydroxybutyrate CoA-transferase [Defluviitaleaceae bacterium]|nr:4-hydroxybutyrate CoA-transferase [Defluviitaleaceae bacterium]